MTNINLLTIDTETTMNGNSDIGLAHPMCPVNRAVLTGCKDEFGLAVMPGLTHFPEQRCDFVVGHNLPFDLLYMYKMDNKEVFQKCRLWDTQLAEYLLSGQQARWASLDQLAVKYGLPLKEDKIKKYFEAGIGADKIPLAELRPYLEQDVANTEAIARIQIAKAAELGMLPQMISQMEALHATTEMMWNGMHVDKAELDRYTVEVVNEYANTKLDLSAIVVGDLEDVDSATKWSKYFFGGKEKYIEKEAVGVYKNGKTKYKNITKERDIKGIYTYTIPNEWKSEKTGKVGCDEKILDVLTKYPETKEVAAKLLQYRNLSKQLSTYVQGLAKHIQGDYIYGQLNHCATVTGRLSSAKPNLQNISNNPIKRIFTSRFGSEGSLVEVDFAQLEIAALAHVTRDKQLIKDIMTGTDIHSALFKEMYGYTPSKEERKPFKSLSFGLIYGAGFKTLAENAKCSVDSAKKFVKTFYDRYPSVKNWHDSFKAKADKEAEHLVSKEGVDKARTFIYISETGRQFYFKEYFDHGRWNARDYDFSPTELKNYPVQGLATGDIGPLMLGILFRKFVNQEGIKCVNTIHDSIMFDVKDEVKDQFIKEIMNELGKTHEYFEATFGKPLALKLSAGVSVGKNWYDMKELEI